jgi:glutathione S-transferase
MKLFCSLTSPYARKVRVVIDELGLTEQVEEVLTDPFSPSPELLVANPLSRIPTLISDRGEALPDSRLIIDYLQARGRPLAALPRGTQRWAAMRRLQLAEGIMDAAVATVLEALNHEAAALSLRAVGLIEITTGVALAYLDFRMPYLEWRRGHEPLMQWFESFSRRPSMLKTQPPAT